MTLKLLYGRAGSGKTKYCLDEINNKLKWICESVIEEYTAEYHEAI